MRRRRVKRLTGYAGSPPGNDGRRPSGVRCPRDTGPLTNGGRPRHFRHGLPPLDTGNATRASTHAFETETQALRLVALEACTVPSRHRDAVAHARDADLRGARRQAAQVEAAV